jgi:hypothetical protein
VLVCHLQVAGACFRTRCRHLFCETCAYRHYSTSSACALCETPLSDSDIVEVCKLHQRCLNQDACHGAYDLLIAGQRCYAAICSYVHCRTASANVRSRVTTSNNSVGKLCQLDALVMRPTHVLRLLLSCYYYVTCMQVVIGVEPSAPFQDALYQQLYKDANLTTVSVSISTRLTGFA